MERIVEFKRIPTKEIPLEQIKEGERYREKIENIDDLMESLNENGLIQPIAVRKDADDSYTLIVGGRRLQAATNLGWEKISARVYPTKLDELQLRSLELDENLQREDMTFDEIARLRTKKHKLLIEQHGGATQAHGDGGWSARKSADAMNISHTVLNQDLDIVAAMEANPEQFKGVKKKNEAVSIVAKMKEKAVKEEMARRAKDKPDLQTSIVTSAYNVGNFFEWIQDFSPKSFGFVELDPPYAIDLTSVKGHTAEGYNEVEASGYEEFMSEVFREVDRVTTKNAWMVSWLAAQYIPLFTSLLRKLGWYVSDQPIIWTKGSGQTKQPAYNLASDYELALYSRKGKPLLNSPGHGHVFDHKPVSPDKKNHPTERPIELIKEILDVFSSPGTSVLSPFLGSGATILAGFEVGRKVVGCDLSDEYYNSFVYKVKQKWG